MRKAPTLKPDASASNTKDIKKSGKASIRVNDIAVLRVLKASSASGFHFSGFLQECCQGSGKYGILMYKFVVIPSETQKTSQCCHIFGNWPLNHVFVVGFISLDHFI